VKRCVCKVQEPSAFAQMKVTDYAARYSYDPMELLDEAHHSDPLLIAYLAERQLWLSQLRWIAIGGILKALSRDLGTLRQAIERIGEQCVTPWGKD